MGQALFRKPESKGVVGLACWDHGFEVMSANRPLRTPADMKGLKVRIQSSKVGSRVGKDTIEGVYRQPGFKP